MRVWMNPFSAIHGHRLTLPYARTCEAYILDLLCNGKKSYGTGFWDFVFLISKITEERVLEAVP